MKTNITLKQLKRQARLYSREHGIKLSEAQEIIAKQEGFVNFHHAVEHLKDVKPLSLTENATYRVDADASIRDLHDGIELLVNRHMSRHYPRFTTIEEMDSHEHERKREIRLGESLNDTFVLAERIAGAAESLSGQTPGWRVIFRFTAAKLTGDSQVELVLERGLLNEDFEVVAENSDHESRAFIESSLAEIMEYIRHEIDHLNRKASFFRDYYEDIRVVNKAAANYRSKIINRERFLQIITETVFIYDKLTKRNWLHDIEKDVGERFSEFWVGEMEGEQRGGLWQGVKNAISRSAG